MGDASGGDHGAATGQSSWGPTGFVIVPTQAQAETLLQSARATNALGPELSVSIVGARNHGALISDGASMPSPQEPA